MREKDECKLCQKEIDKQKDKYTHVNLEIMDSFKLIGKDIILVCGQCGVNEFGFGYGVKVT